MSAWFKTILRIEGMIRRTHGGLLAFGLLPGIAAGLIPAPASGQSAPVAESKVKAALVANFVAFVDWPESAFPGTNSPIVVAVLGKDSIGKDLELALERKSTKGRRLFFRRVLADSELRGCHVLFVPSSERKRVRDTFDKLGQVSVLTIGESDDFLDQGGVINFLLKDGSVRFEINLKPAQLSGLKLDANLVKIAESVRGKYE